VRARGGEPGADSIEQAFAVGGEYADARGAALRIIVDDDIRPGLADPRFGLRDLARVGGLPRERLGKPVAVGQPLRVGPDRARLPSERPGELLLPLLDDLAPAILLVAEPEPLLRGLEQGSQKRALPLVPDSRADGADVDNGEDEQQPQSLRALHLACDILDRLRIGEVALERRR